MSILIVRILNALQAILMSTLALYANRVASNMATTFASQSNGNVTKVNNQKSM